MKPNISTNKQNNSQTALFELLRELIRVRFPHKSTYITLNKYLQNFYVFPKRENQNLQVTQSKTKESPVKLKEEVKQQRRKKQKNKTDTDARVFKIVDSFFIYYNKLKTTVEKRRGNQNPTT